MNDHIAEIDQHPLSGFLSFHRDDITPSLLDLVPYMRRQSARLPIGGAAHNRHTVKKTGERDGVEQFDVLRLDVLKCVNNDSL